MFETFWLVVAEQPPEVGKEKLLFHKDWIDEDFNPDGIRLGFLTDEGNYLVAHWLDSQDCYHTHENDVPSHWAEKPTPPNYFNT